MKRNPVGLFLDRFSPPQGLLLMLLAILIGGVTGLAAVFFIRLIALIQESFYTLVHALLPMLGIWTYLAVPVIGALLAGPLIAWFAREAKGHGVPEVMQALVQRGGRIRARVAVAKIFASALCIGSGGSAGREGPIVQVGSALGSVTGQILHLSDERIKNLVACGAAAGIAATFNAPIAGVAFAIEVLMSGLQVRMFGNVVIAAVSASIVSQVFLGDQPAFLVPAYAMSSPVEILLYLGLGLAAAVVGIFFIRTLDYFERRFDGWDFPLALKPVVGAILLGVLGMGYLLVSGSSVASLSGYGAEQLAAAKPSIFGSGFAFIERAIRGEASFLPFLFLVLLKPLATSFTLGSGNSGGVFAPSLFTGAMLGGAMGALYASWLPEYAGPTGAYALVGMAAVFAACAHAPLTAILIVFEMSSDYGLILPLMIAAVTASNLAQYLYQESMYTTKLTRRGIRFVQGRDLDIMQAVAVREVMTDDPVVIAKDAPLAELYQMFQETNYLGFPVVDEQGLLWGIVTLQDLEKVLVEDDLPLRSLRVEDVAIVDPVTVHADEPIWTAIQKMAPRDLARLPVVSRSNEKTLIGLISRSNILRAYDVGIIRKQRGQLLEDQLTLRREERNIFIEVRLQQEDRAVGVMLKELELSEAVNVVSIERDGVLQIPRGSSRFASGDIVTLFVRKEAVDLARRQLSGQANESY
ncbi:chloride channel protein [Desulfogranum mediterraneum]|uniref:chloride channel protein n=1 Tax=Desulfogranum mediterraneum TaxID=160661 RepID=UPI0003FD9249|nr:chloride channel protein [Desulfogranum mediterraneum]